MEELLWWADNEKKKKKSGTVMSVLYEFSQVISTAGLWSRCNYNSHFTDEDAEASTTSQGHWVIKFENWALKLDSWFPQL